MNLIGFFSNPLFKDMDMPIGKGISDGFNPASCDGGRSGNGISLALVRSASLTCSNKKPE